MIYSVLVQYNIILMHKHKNVRIAGTLLLGLALG